jgi:hypothetical protein
MREGINKKSQQIIDSVFFWNETNFSFIDELSTEFDRCDQFLQKAIAASVLIF